MISTKKDQIFDIQSSTEDDETKGSLPNDSTRGGLHFLIKNNNNSSICCYLCSKKFPTIKSLCGHMRSHPEREWRGIHPPLYLNDHDHVIASSSSNHSSSADVDVVVDADLSASLGWGWSTTSKRGRKSLSSSSRIREVQEHHMVQEEGVYELMLLAGVLQCEAKKDSLIDSVESSRKSRSRVGIEIENRNMNQKKNKKKGSKRMKLNEIGMNKLDVVICNESFQCYQSNTIQNIDEFQSHHEHDHHSNITTTTLEEAKSSQEITSLVEKSPKILSFDLNMPPTMDHEKEEEKKGIQSEIIIPYYAPSFQNSGTKW